MSTIIWPPLPPADLDSAVAQTAHRELEWLLGALLETLSSLKAGLEECSALLAPRDSGSTLVLSSQRSESLKGFVTLNGARLTKGDIHIRLPTLPPPRGQHSYRLTVSSAPSAPSLVIPQLLDARTLINACLDVVDATRWTGDARSAEYISSQLRLLQEHVADARAALKGDGPCPPWHAAPLDKATFDPPLPPTLALHFSVADAALVFVVRTLDPLPASPDATGASTPTTAQQSYTGFSIRDRLAQAFGGPASAAAAQRHDEADAAFSYMGRGVRVRDKVRVEAMDPSLMAALAKLSALEHTVALGRRALDVVMGRDGAEDDE